MSLAYAPPPPTCFLLASSRRQSPICPRLPWISRTSCCQSKARVTCVADDGSKEEAARKALEQAFEPSKRAFKKWDEEIKNRQAKIDDSSGGRGWGGGGGGGDEGPDGDNSWDWEEAREVFLATSALIFLYLLITVGPKGLYAVTALMVKYVLQGFRFRVIPKDKNELSRQFEMAEAGLNTGRRN